MSVWTYSLVKAARLSLLSKGLFSVRGTSLPSKSFCRPTYYTSAADISLFPFSLWFLLIKTYKFLLPLFKQIERLLGGIWNRCTKFFKSILIYAHLVTLPLNRHGSMVQQLKSLYRSFCGACVYGVKRFRISLDVQLHLFLVCLFPVFSTSGWGLGFSLQQWENERQWFIMVWVSLGIRKTPTDSSKLGWRYGIVRNTQWFCITTFWLRFLSGTKVTGSVHPTLKTHLGCISPDQL